MKEGSVGVMTTHAADSLSTDSAAAATALAGGCKANIGALGICADGTLPVSAMEIARRRGMRLGLVTNADVYDASPAAFVCHVPNRRDFTSDHQSLFGIDARRSIRRRQRTVLAEKSRGSRRDDETTWSPPLKN